MARSSAIFLASMYSYSPTSPSTCQSSRLPFFGFGRGPLGATASSLAGLGGVLGASVECPPMMPRVDAADAVDAAARNRVRSPADVSRPPRRASKSMRFAGLSVGPPAVDDAGVDPRALAVPSSDFSVLVFIISVSNPSPRAVEGASDLTLSASAV